MDENWKVFANCKYDPASDNWEMMKRDIISIYAESPPLAAAGR
jgi:hypothetical protein